MLRRAVREDVPTLARIYTGALRETYQSILPEDYLQSLTQEAGEAVWQRYLSQPEREVWVEEAGEIAGFAACKPDASHSGWLELSSLYLDRRHQGRGLGKALIHAIWDRARALGCDGVSVCVVRDNQRARGLYEGMGAVFLNGSIYHFGSHPVDCRNYVWHLAAAEPGRERKDNV